MRKLVPALVLAAACALPAQAQSTAPSSPAPLPAATALPFIADRIVLNAHTTSPPVPAHQTMDVRADFTPFCQLVVVAQNGSILPFNSAVGMVLLPHERLRNVANGNDPRHPCVVLYIAFPSSRS